VIAWHKNNKHLPRRRERQVSIAVPTPFHFFFKVSECLGHGVIERRPKVLWANVNQ